MNKQSGYRNGQLIYPVSVVDHKKEPESGGGGGEITPGVPIPHDTVDSDSIIDGSVEMQDLSNSVKDEMITKDDRVTQDDLDRFNV